MKTTILANLQLPFFWQNILMGITFLGISIWIIYKYQKDFLKFLGSNNFFASLIKGISLVIILFLSLIWQIIIMSIAATIMVIVGFIFLLIREYENNYLADPIHHRC